MLAMNTGIHTGIHTARSLRLRDFPYTLHPQTEHYTSTVDLFRLTCSNLRFDTNHTNQQTSLLTQISNPLIPTDSAQTACTFLLRPLSQHPQPLGLRAWRDGRVWGFQHTCAWKEMDMAFPSWPAVSKDRRAS